MGNREKLPQSILVRLPENDPFGVCSTFKHQVGGQPRQFPHHFPSLSFLPSSFYKLLLLTSKSTLITLTRSTRAGFYWYLSFADWHSVNFCQQRVLEIHRRRKGLLFLVLMYFLLSGCCDGLSSGVQDTCGQVQQEFGFPVGCSQQ